MMPARFDIEAHSSAATLYLRGRLTTDDLPELRVACSLLPHGVRLLRIDAGAVPGEDRGTRRVLDTVVRHWRRTRGESGELRAAEWAGAAARQRPQCPQCPQCRRCCSEAAQ